MLDIIRSGGWLMAPILLCSVVALAIVLERLWTLQRRRVLPPELVAGVAQLLRASVLTPERLAELRAASPLGTVLAAGIEATTREAIHESRREAIREAMEDAARQVALDLERFLTALGVIASIAPLLGLL
ncbi:MAG: MotA/TolQ/ExbB proton channel family protein, partial [Gammaproteobacteria bacterium]